MYFQHCLHGNFVVVHVPRVHVSVCVCVAMVTECVIVLLWLQEEMSPSCHMKQSSNKNVSYTVLVFLSVCDSYQKKTQVFGQVDLSYVVLWFNDIKLVSIIHCDGYLLMLPLPVFQWSTLGQWSFWALSRTESTTTWYLSSPTSLAAVSLVSLLLCYWPNSILLLAKYIICIIYYLCCLGDGGLISPHVIYFIYKNMYNVRKIHIVKMFVICVILNTNFEKWMNKSCLYCRHDTRGARPRGRRARLPLCIVTGTDGAWHTEPLVHRGRAVQREPVRHVRGLGQGGRGEGEPSWK